MSRPGRLPPPRRSPPLRRPPRRVPLLRPPPGHLRRRRPRRDRPTLPLLPRRRRREPRPVRRRPPAHLLPAPRQRPALLLLARRRRRALPARLRRQLRAPRLPRRLLPEPLRGPPWPREPRRTATRLAARRQHRRRVRRQFPCWGKCRHWVSWRAVPGVGLPARRVPCWERRRLPASAAGVVRSSSAVSVGRVRLSFFPLLTPWPASSPLAVQPTS